LPNPIFLHCATPGNFIIFSGALAIPAENYRRQVESAIKWFFKMHGIGDAEMPNVMLQLEMENPLS
jgi:hypothetical protein